MPQRRLVMQGLKEGTNFPALEANLNVAQGREGGWRGARFFVFTSKKNYNHHNY